MLSLPVWLSLLAIARQEATIYVVPDLKNFIVDRAWAKAETMADDFHMAHPNPKKIPIKEREALGLQFVEEVVSMFVSEGMAQQVHCLNNKTVSWLGSHDRLIYNYN